MTALSQAPLQQFVLWCAEHISGDEKGEAQIFLDQLFRAFGHTGFKEAGATCEMRVKKAGKGTSFADLVWKPVVLVEMKKRGEDLSKHYSQAFTYWTRLVPNRPQYVVLCNFDEFWIYDFNSQSVTAAQVDAVANAGRQLREVRAQALQSIDGGLRALYRTLDLPGKNPLKDAHTALDSAVLKAYGFTAKQDLLEELLKLNVTMGERVTAREPVAGPGVPANYPEPNKLVSNDAFGKLSLTNATDEGVPIEASS